MLCTHGWTVQMWLCWRNWRRSKSSWRRNIKLWGSRRFSTTVGDQPACLLKLMLKMKTFTFFPPNQFKRFHNEKKNLISSQAFLVILIVLGCRYFIYSLKGQIKYCANFFCRLLWFKKKKKFYLHTGNNWEKMRVTPQKCQKTGEFILVFFTFYHVSITRMYKSGVLLKTTHLVVKKIIGL